MATDFLPKIVEGPIGTEAKVISCIADEAIELWSPVILVAAGSGEDLPRVEPTNIAHDVDVYGVVVGPILASGKAADVAGELVNVCVGGRSKIKVDGAAAAIAIGDSLVTHDADGVAQKADFTITAAVGGSPTDAELNAWIKNLAAVFAIALHASTVDGDIIPCDVNKVAGDTA